MVFENNELSMDGKATPNRFYASASKLSSGGTKKKKKKKKKEKKKKKTKPLILTQKSNQSNFCRKIWLFYVCYDVCNEKKSD